MLEAYWILVSRYVSYGPTETTSLMEKLLKMKSIWHAEHGKESYIFRFDVQEVRTSCRHTKIPSL